MCHWLYMFSWTVYSRYKTFELFSKVNNGLKDYKFQRIITFSVLKQIIVMDEVISNTLGPLLNTKRRFLVLFCFPTSIQKFIYNTNSKDICPYTNCTIVYQYKKLSNYETHCLHLTLHLFLLAWNNFYPLQSVFAESFSVIKILP